MPACEVVSVQPIALVDMRIPSEVDALGNVAAIAGPGTAAITKIEERIS